MNSARFSSLSESGFIPTAIVKAVAVACARNVLISFREWLHSYYAEEEKTVTVIVSTKFSSLSESGFIPTGEPCL